jgi:hypothetical protein
VLPTSNEWISLRDIRASDGALGTFDLLSTRHRGLLQVSGTEGKPMILPSFASRQRAHPAHFARNGCAIRSLEGAGAGTGTCAAQQS